MEGRFVLVGAGSAVFTRGLVADMIRRGVTGRLALVDTDPEALKVAEMLTRKMLTARKAKIHLSASTDRRDVLRGATVVICTIGVGGRRAWEQDVFIPRKYGIYQPVGDSVMPGGASRAMRMIPAMAAIAEDVLDLAPKALFFNYGNPMPPVCRGVRKATGADVVGLCHGVFHVACHLAGILGVDVERMDYSAVGMNHLTWFTRLEAQGKDLMSRLLGIAPDILRALAQKAENSSDPATCAASDRFTWELVELLGAFPAVMDRHITEFFPQLFGGEGAYYGRTLGVDAYSFEETISQGDEAFETMRRQALSPDALPEDFFDRLAGEHEQVVEIIESIRKDARRVFSANVPNCGQIPNLPGDAIVECPCMAGSDGLRPIPQPPMDAALVGTLAGRFPWVETVVDAALRKSPERFVQALLLDGAVDSVATARRLAGDLLKAQATYLPWVVASGSDTFTAA